MLISIGFCYADDVLPIIDIKTGDCEKVQIEIYPNDKPQLSAYLMQEQLVSARKIIDENFEKQICIKINGVIVSQPIIHIRKPYRGFSVGIGFPDLNSAVKAAEQLIPQK